MKSALYYEAHITIEPVFGERLERLKEIARPFKFKVADLLMKKREQDTAERSANDTFMTGHGVDYEDMSRRIRFLVHAAKQEGYQVWRYKLEDTMFDSRKEDVLGIL